MTYKLTEAYIAAFCERTGLPYQEYLRNVRTTSYHYFDGSDGEGPPEVFVYFDDGTCGRFLPNELEKVENES